MKFLTAHYSDQGQKHQINDDSLVAEVDLGLFSVADGMGAYKGGKFASNAALEVIVEYLKSAKTEMSQSQYTELKTELLSQSIQAANYAIYNHSLQNNSLNGMGTTLTALFFSKTDATIGHVGDSRCFHFHSNELTQLTKDHSVERRSSDGKTRRTLSRAVGFEKSVEVDISTHQYQSGDVFLICSDGLTEFLESNEIANILKRQHHLEKVCFDLVRSSRLKGSDDDISLVLVKIMES